MNTSTPIGTTFRMRERRRPSARNQAYFISGLLLLAAMPAAAAEDETVLSLLHMVWIAVCAALVLFMQPGFAFLEAGAARAKNSVNVIMKNFSDLAFGSIGFWALGFGVMFGANSTGFFGVGSYMPSFDDNAAVVNLVYHTMFAATAATIVSGAVAERIRYFPYLIGAVSITMLIYPIYGSWVWGGVEGAYGWLKELGFHDAAGGTVVHSIGGWCALGAILVLGPRVGRFSRRGESREIPGHNLPMFALGGFILWFGWFGFNGGAAASDFSNLGRILLNTNLGAAAGVVGALATMQLTRAPVLMTTTVNGALGGLVSVTAGCDVLDPAFALIVGLIAGSICTLTVNLLNQARIDDVVGAVPVHGVCGAWGTIAIGLFHMDGMFNLDLLLVQMIGVVAAFLFAVPASWLIFTIIDKTIGLRASTQHEQRGLDFAEHYEVGYGDFMAVQTHAGKEV